MSTLKADTIQSTGGGAATLTKQSAAKAWSSLDSSGGSTATQHGSFNVSSVLDDGTGQYGFNFTNNMNGATYSSVGSCNDNSSYNCVTNWTGVPSAYTSGRTGMGVLNIPTSTYADSDVCVVVNGDLA